MREAHARSQAERQLRIPDDLGSQPEADGCRDPRSDLPDAPGGGAYRESGCDGCKGGGNRQLGPDQAVIPGRAHQFAHRDEQHECHDARADRDGGRSIEAPVRRRQPSGQDR
jgi:hypothetical protein